MIDGRYAADLPDLGWVEADELLQAALAKLSFDTPTGKVSLDANRNAIADNFVTEVVKNADGTLSNKVVSPSSSSTSSPNPPGNRRFRRRRPRRRTTVAPRQRRCRHPRRYGHRHVDTIISAAALNADPTTRQRLLGVG